jgi:hypothetical protein
MATTQPQTWYNEHRAWEDVASLILGAIALVSPYFTGMTGDTAIIVSSVGAGGLIVILGAVEMVALRRWEEWLEMLCGAWLVVAPFALHYAGTMRSLHVVIGALVFLLAAFEMWQDSDRDLPA